MTASTSKNTLWNVAGIALPLIVGLATISIMVKNIGAERFGFVVLSWAIAGYFNVFDFGMGRALTVAVSQQLGKTDRPAADLIALCRGAYAALLVLGMIGALVLGALASQIAQTALNLPPHLLAEGALAVMVLAATVPITVLNAAANGILAGFNRFASLNKIRIAVGMATSLFPAFTSHYTDSLVSITLALLLARALGFVIVHLVAARTVGVRLLTGSFSDTGRHAKQLLVFGGWMSLSNLLGPIMVYFDRFIVGAVVSVKAVAYYSTPFTLVSRLGIFGEALAAALLPRFARDHAAGKHSADKLAKPTLWILHCTMPFCLILIFLGHSILARWLGNDFAENGNTVLRFACVGVICNSIAQLPFAFIQAAGRADITAKLHLGEVPFYICALVVVLPTHGIAGAAAVWAVRATADAALLFWLAGRLVKPHSLTTATRSGLGAAISASFAFLLCASLPPLGLVHSAQALMAALALYAAVAWCTLPDPQRRMLRLTILKGRRRLKSI